LIDAYLTPLLRCLGLGQPYRWQAAAFERLVDGDVPAQIKVPTAAGKTMLLAVFVAAQAARAARGDTGLHRRLVHVVNRRVLVDEATRLCERLQHALISDPALAAHREALRGLSATGQALAVATLRGGLEDRGDWSADPSSTALILATPDMLGSRLLFRGYGLGPSRAATQAGLLGIDTLVVHDEAHLAPAFTTLLRQVEARCSEAVAHTGRPPLQVIEMTATLGAGASLRPLVCTVADDPALARRMSASKRLRVLSVGSASGARTGTSVLDSIAQSAAQHRAGNRAVAVFVNTPAVADAIAGRLVRAGVSDERIVVLTGTMRGYERERLSGSRAFLRFHPGEQRTDDGTAYFIATSAGEIGLDIDADVGIFDLGTVDRLVQRAGRINRRGLVAGVIELHHAQGQELPEALQPRARATLELLSTLPADAGGLDASPLALAALCDHALWPAACDPPPPLRLLEPAVLRMLSMTSLRLDELGCPGPDVYIHGLVDDDAQLQLAWRHLPAPGADLGEWLDRWPVLPAECAKLPLDAARRLLERRLASLPAGERLLAVALDPQGQPVAVEPVPRPGQRLRSWLYRLRPGGTVLLDCGVGGLNPQGLPAPDAADAVMDVSAACRVEYPPARVQAFELRCRLEDERPLWQADGQQADGQQAETLDALLPALVRGLSADASVGAESAASAPSLGGGLELVFHDGPGATLDLPWAGKVTCWLAPRVVRSADAGDLAALGARDRALGEHLDLAARAAARLAARLDLSTDLRDALIRAAAEHDAGKAWARWQRAIGNADPANPLGKSASTAFDFKLNDGYRHELGSLVDRADRLGSLDSHLVAAHHGWARPGYIAAALDKPGCAAAGKAASLRFARLDTQLGPWALAWLEALLKAADIQAETHADELAVGVVANPVPLPPAPSATPSNADGLEPRFELPVDALNFGEVLACLGLATLVEPLQPDLRLAWEPSRFVLHGVDTAAVASALARIHGASVHPDDGATMVEMAGAAFPPLRLMLADGSPIALNHWLDERLSGKSAWKLGAGQMKALDTLRSALVACQRSLALEGFVPERIFAIGGALVGADTSKFRFDAATSWSAQDAGFSLNENDAFKSVRPWVELLSALGLQAWLLPPADRIHDEPRYHLWREPLPPTLALVALRGLLPESGPGLVPVFTTSGQMKDVFPSRPHTTRRSPACRTLVTLI
jgi:CRISPR-associated endonuclease/helicase Cas3